MIPQEANRERGGEGASGPEADGEFPAIILRKATGHFVAESGAHVTHEINKAGGGGGGAASGEVGRKGADEQNLRAEDAKADAKQNQK